MARKRGLGNGLAALIPKGQEERKEKSMEVFFATEVEVSRETLKAVENIKHSDDRGSDTKKNIQEVELKEVENKKNTKSKRVSLGERMTGAEVAQPSARDNQTDKELLPVPGATYAEIPVSYIVPNTKQPRTVFDEEELEELTQSILEVGVLQPVIVRPLTAPLEGNDEARYELIMGERRWRASKRAGKETVPAIVRRTADEDLLRDALLENLHRAQLNPLEEAAAYQQLLDDFDCTQEELSKRIARSRPQITNTLRLLKLPSLVQRRVAAGVITAGHARALLGLSDSAAMERLAQRIVAENLSVRQVEELVALGDSGEEEKNDDKTKRTIVSIPQLENLGTRLGDHFDTKVKVTMGKRKGTIKIDFAGQKDLNRILALLSPDEEEIDF
ncbi:MAG: ParB/RepB/Spo0J family partition protein [Actinomycetaceae bacterium]|nr:ParB/RepB/Spo0J family partition protein [Actinomycetaceae bacterium]